MIRTATADDIPEVTRLFVAEHGEIGVVSIDMEKVIDKLGAALQNGLIFVAGDAEGLVGALMIGESAPWYSRDSVLRDFAFYVEPAFRDLNIGHALAAAAKAEAKRRGLPLIVTVTNPERARKRGMVATLEGFFPLGWVSRLS